MDRLALTSLNNWKIATVRKPMLLLGARQVGKSYLILDFGAQAFKKIHVFDFELDPGLAAVFQRDLDPYRILAELSIRQRSKGEGSIKENHLIVFDEIQESPRALASLRYFYEKAPERYVIAAGSPLGVKLSESFPVGRVQELNLFPMSFEEFLLAVGDELAVELYQSTSRLQEAHNILWQHFLDYLFVGGMPEAVMSWKNGSDLVEKVRLVTEIQSTILSQYYKDFVKHSGKVNANHILRVFDNVPRQLARLIDSSVKRFKFKGVLPGQSKYSQISGPIEWLKEAGLVNVSSVIDGQFGMPLEAFTKDNMFKLFFFDVGLLGNKLGLGYEMQHGQDYGIIKGYIAENFVACELRAKEKKLYSWQGGKSEIEFLIATQEGDVLPVEVKSGRRTQAKSLKVYIEKFLPTTTLKLVGKVGGTDQLRLVWPIYYAGKIASW